MVRTRSLRRVRPSAATTKQHSTKGANDSASSAVSTGGQIVYHQALRIPAAQLAHDIPTAGPRKNLR